MDPRMLSYYNRELQHLREMGGEFARRYPKIAGRLALEEFECADPYVERLLEGLAFLAARVQLKLDAQYPEFTQHLLEIVYPHYVAPTPSMAVVHFEPDYNEGALAKGSRVPRGTMLLSRIGKGEQTPCRYQTAHDVTLWPLQIKQADYYSRDEAMRGAPDVPRRAGRACGLRLACTAGLTFDKIALDRLPLFLQGLGRIDHGPLRAIAGEPRRHGGLPRRARRPPCADDDRCRRRSAALGFQEDEALLPYGPRSFQGYRLLHEYFAMPERFLFVELGGLSPALRRCPGNEIDLFILFNRVNRVLEHRVDASLFSLFCTPAVNLFPKRADRIQIDNRQAEFQILPDRTRPLDYEPYQVTEVTGYGDGDKQQAFLPFYAALSRGDGVARSRSPRRCRPPITRCGGPIARFRSSSAASGPRTSYVGSELIPLAGRCPGGPLRPRSAAAFRVAALHESRPSAARCRWGWATPISRRRSARPFARPAASSGRRGRAPTLSYGTGETAWRLVNHLSLNYASLVNDPQRGGAAALREMLSLYADMAEPHVRKQIDGVQSVVARPVTRPVPTSGPLTFARGQQITLTCDESAFEGMGVFLLGAVLEEFFARYVSINSFTETVVRTADRGEIMQWPIRIGRRQSL